MRYLSPANSRVRFTFGLCYAAFRELVHVLHPAAAGRQLAAYSVTRLRRLAALLASTSARSCPARSQPVLLLCDNQYLACFFHPRVGLAVAHHSPNTQWAWLTALSSVSLHTSRNLRSESVSGFCPSVRDCVRPRTKKCCRICSPSRRSSRKSASSYQARASAIL